MSYDNIGHKGTQQEWTTHALILEIATLNPCEAHRGAARFTVQLKTTALRFISGLIHQLYFKYILWGIFSVHNFAKPVIVHNPRYLSKQIAAARNYHSCRRGSLRFKRLFAVRFYSEWSFLRFAVRRRFFCGLRIQTFRALRLRFEKMNRARL